MPVKRYTWRQMVLVVWAIGWSDFVMKYRGSFLGYLWSFAPMIVRFLVIFHIFRPFMGEKVPYYHLYLFLGLIVWQHFSGVRVHLCARKQVGNHPESKFPPYPPHACGRLSASDYLRH